MTEDENLTPPLGEYLKAFLFQTELGMAIGIGSAALGLFAMAYAGGRALDHYYPEEKQIIQRNVIGNEAPDIYIEKDGVKYFSHIDGKDISNLVHQ